MAAAADIVQARLSQAAGAPDAEFELLLACCREKSDAVLDALLATPLNWDLTLRLADHHRLVTAAFAALSGRSGVPASIQSALYARFQAHARKTLRFCAELTATLRKFEDCGIEVLAHKGPVLARILYGDPAMRQFGDLDFLIRAKDVSRARTALQELGYKANLQLSQQQEIAFLGTSYEYVFGCDAGANIVELQWQILPRFYSVPFDMESLFSRSVEREFEGRLVRSLGNEDLMLVLCVHAAKHGWPHLGMLRDIAALAQLDLSWEWIRNEARRLGIRRIVSISLRLIRNLLGSDFREQFPLTKPENDLCDRLSADVVVRLRHGEEIDPVSLAYFRIMVRLRERWQDRARFWWRLAVTPSVGEWESAAVPDRLFFLYRGVRAGRLARKFLGRANAVRKRLT